MQKLKLKETTEYMKQTSERWERKETNLKETDWKENEGSKLQGNFASE